MLFPLVSGARQLGSQVLARRARRCFDLVRTGRQPQDDLRPPRHGLIPKHRRIGHRCAGCGRLSRPLEPGQKASELPDIQIDSRNGCALHGVRTAGHGHFLLRPPSSGQIHTGLLSPVSSPRENPSEGGFATPSAGRGTTRSCVEITITCKGCMVLSCRRGRRWAGGAPIGLLGGSMWSRQKNPFGAILQTGVESDLAEVVAEEIVHPSRDRKSTRLNSSHMSESRMPSSA